jgi:hypothetical protein
MIDVLLFCLNTKRLQWLFKIVLHIQFNVLVKLPKSLSKYVPTQRNGELVSGDRVCENVAVNHWINVNQYGAGERSNLPQDTEWMLMVNGPFNIFPLGGVSCGEIHKETMRGNKLLIVGLLTCTVESLVWDVPPHWWFHESCKILILIVLTAV